MLGLHPILCAVELMLLSKMLYLVFRIVWVFGMSERLRGCFGSVVGLLFVCACNGLSPFIWIQIEEPRTIARTHKDYNRNSIYPKPD